MSAIPSITPAIHVHPDEKGVTVLDVIGLIRHGDCEGSSALETELNGHINDGRTRIILDMQVAWMDSLTLCVIIQACKRLRPLEESEKESFPPGPDPNADLKLVVDPSGPLAKMLKVARLTEVFMVFSTRAEALASFNEPPRLFRR